MPTSVTQLLEKYRLGDKAAVDQLMASVYAELKVIARHYLRGKKGETLQPTVLVNEAYLRLFSGEKIDLASRAHFFGLAAKAMRSILIDHLRRKGAVKRGGDQFQLNVDEIELGVDGKSVDLLDIDRALKKLEGEDKTLAHLVELRYFGGLSVEETALVLDCSETSVKRGWVTARVFLLRELQGPKTKIQTPRAQSR